MRTEREGTSTNNTDKEAGSVTPAQVKLIQATRLPAHHCKLIRVEIDGQVVDSETSLFEPELHTLSESGLSMADAVVGVGGSRNTSLMISNQGTEPVQLEKGVVLGRMQPVTLLDDWTSLKTPEDEENHTSSLPQVAMIQGEDGGDHQEAASDRALDTGQT